MLHATTFLSTLDLLAVSCANAIQFVSGVFGITVIVFVVGMESSSLTAPGLTKLKSDPLPTQVEL